MFEIDFSRSNGSHLAVIPVLTATNGNNAITESRKINLMLIFNVNYGLNGIATKFVH